MSWQNQLERLAAPIAIPGLIRYVAFLSSAAFIIGLAMPGMREMMPLDPNRFLQGEYWRLATFAFIPSSYSMFWIFALMFLFYIGDSLEQAMGVTRLTVFYLCGWIATVATSFIFGAVGTPIFLNLSLLLALGTLYPDSQISIYLIFPVRVKWVAIFSLVAALVFTRGFDQYATLFVCLGNYLLFFGFDLLKSFHTNQQIARRRHEFREKARPIEETLHRCHVCGSTELSDPETEFRVASDGEEYCEDHLPSKTENRI